MADQTKATGSKGLPALPKKRGPFDKLATLAHMPEPPADLREQAARDPGAAKEIDVAPTSRDQAPSGEKAPPADGGKLRGRPANPIEGEQIFLQTTLALPTFQAFKMHCIERRTTVRKELRRLVEEMLERKRR